MAKEEKKKTEFKLIDLPDYDYGKGMLACPECYAPVHRGRVDGRCESCLKSKKILPVNYRRPPKKKTEEEDDYEYV